MSLLMELPPVVHGLSEGQDRRISQVAVREQVWVGIDVRKRSHHACAVDAAGQVIFSQAVGNGQAPIEALIAKATAAGVSVRWALDMTSGTAALLIALLHAQDQPMSYVPGKLVNR